MVLAPNRWLDTLAGELSKRQEHQISRSDSHRFSRTVTGLSDFQRAKVCAETQAWVERGSDIFALRVKPVDVRFDLSGRTSGMFCTKGGACWIRYNPWIFARYFEPSIQETVPHEVAHYLCHLRHGRRARPHGPEWKAIMAAFGKAAEVTCNLDLSDLPQKQYRRFLYRCQCGTHSLTSIRHNRILRHRSRYRCTGCNSELVAM